MIIAVAKEIKTEEYRVALTPAGAAELTKAGHEVLVEQDAGTGSGLPDDDYEKSGATVVSREEVFGRGELILKVKEPLPQEFGLFREGQALFAFLHLAPNAELTSFLREKRITALGYETLEKEGALPLLAPMSEIAGRMAPIVAAYYLQKANGGSGVLPTGMVGDRAAKAVILGAGTVGCEAARIALGMGMETVVLNRGMERLHRVDEVTGGRVRTGTLTQESIAAELADADVIIGAVLLPGGRTPLLIPRSLLAQMRKGAVIVDVAVDQGGCAETTHPTTHADPVYTVDGIIHYAVANMPAAYPRTTSQVLAGATLPYVKQLAKLGVAGAIAKDPVLKSAVNIHDGKIVHPALNASSSA